MALIRCPECNREISDKVKTCPHCGYPFVAENAEPQPAIIQQVEIAGVSIKNKIHTRTFILLFVVIIVGLASFFGIRYFKEQKAQKEYEMAFNNYIDKLEETYTEMLISASDAEELMNLVANVWHDAIFEDYNVETVKYTKENGEYIDDFNDALGNLFSDRITINKMAAIENDQSNVKDFMKELQNPPEGLDTCYESVTKLFSDYISLTNLAINPAGSLQTFGESKNEKIDEFLEDYALLTNQIPDRFEIELEE